MDDGLILYLPGALLIVALAVKAPAMKRNWEQPLIRSVCALLFVGCLVLVLAAPPTIKAVNRLTGITNVAAPLVYSVLTAFSGASIVVILHWRGGPAEQLRRATIWTVTAYSTVTALIIAAFVVGEAPVEQLRTLDTYYANTPYIQLMIVLYLLAHTVGTVAFTTLSWRWFLRVHPTLRPLRTGLALLTVGGVFDLGYLAAKWTAVGARWTGTDWDTLSTDLAPPLASAAALLSGAGFIAPLVGDSKAWRDYRQYRRLHPLWKALHAFAAVNVTTVPLQWWSPIGIRLIHRESVIDDGILAVAPFCEESVRREAYEAAVREGMDEPRALLVADAAMLAVACRAKAAAGEDGQAVRDGVQAAEHRLDDQPLAALAAEFAHSPVVASALGRAVPVHRTGG
ncbi:MAB_1171c family putative transporter [Streptomyces sp. cmx-4-9]|uniref:MAB_1171c family putative transporter n=1 Tax=Streptomyces sp. cmx-4-9 TaxID=2790941 RepID=UPI003981743A